MKKYTKILLPVLLPVVLAGVLIGVVLSRGKQPEKEPETVGKGITVYDSGGNVLATVKSTAELPKSDYWAYLDIAISQATEKVAEIKGWDRETARNHLLTEGYAIRTAFREDAFRALQSADENKAPMGGAVTDLKGNLLAVYSARGDTNYAAAKLPPCDALTPVNLYAPAIEAGTICWSSQYAGITIYEGLRTASETVAEQIAAQKAGEEIYPVDPKTGITPVDMAGIYQCFASGGQYTAPKAIMEITDGAGNVIYTADDSYRQIISAETADIMVRLLQGVVKTGGTGSGANCKDIQVAGKTGADGENFWFAGITPGYSVAIWHGQDSSNRADDMFAAVIEALYKDQPNANRNFITHKNLQRLIYCTNSGMAISKDCSTIEEGYFGENNIPGICDKCSENENREAE